VGGGGIKRIGDRMQSFRYIEEKVLSARQGREFRYYIAIFFGLLCMLSIAFFIAPVIHELSHMAFLNVFGCNYSFDIFFAGGTEFYAEIHPLCSLEVSESSAVLAAGVTTTSVAGIILFLLAWRAERLGKLPLSIFLILISFGFLVDPLTYLFRGEGDLVNILSINKATGLFILLPLAGLLILFLLSIYLFEYTSHILNDYMQIREELKEAQLFIKQVKSGS
jgi:hypothetical protein